MTRALFLSAIGLMLPALVLPAGAQTRTGFIEAAILADYDPTLRSNTSTTAGISVSAGLFVSPRWSLRAEIEYPQWHESHNAGEGRTVFRVEKYDVREERRSPSVSLLAGRRAWQNSRAEVSLLGGVTMTRRDSRTSGFTETYDFDGNLLSRHEVARESRGFRWLALSTGADVAIKVTEHLAVVPQLRVHSYIYSEHTSLLFVRPRVSLRYSF